MLKNVDPNEYPTECGIANYFSSKELADIPENHCVPIYEALQAPGEDITVLVMPLLRKCMDPPFETVGEVMDFLGQVFEVRPVTSPLAWVAHVVVLIGHTFHASTQGSPSVCTA